MTAGEWAELVRMSGGPSALLDALEGVAAHLLRAELERRTATPGC